jgi:hypothetical protein
MKLRTGISVNIMKLRGRKKKNTMKKNKTNVKKTKRRREKSKRNVNEKSYHPMPSNWLLIFGQLRGSNYLGCWWTM